MPSLKMSSLLATVSLIGALHAYTPPATAVSALNSYRSYSDLTSAAGSMDIDEYAKNLITWQMPHGGFFKAYAAKYVNAWNETDARSDQVRNGVELGTIDNNATIQEMRLLAVRYKSTANSTYKSQFKTAFQKALGFIVTSQQSKGGWPQMYPARGNYSDMATYNDNAMIRVMVLAKDIVDRLPPFDTDIATDTERNQLQSALNKAVDFSLNAQIYNGNQPTVWCAQHDPNTYAPVAARSYELASKSGSESAGIVWFLMNWPDQTTAIQNAVKGALAWYKNNRVPDMKFSSGNFVSSPGASMWYRFYEVSTDDYFFCDRAGVSTKTQDITTLSDDRRYGYQWAGDYGSTLLSAESGYLSAIASVPTSSVAPSSSTVPISSSSVANPVTAECGGTACTTLLQGENFCNVQGVAESKNAGYMGTGYVNLDNTQGSSVGYALLTLSAANATVFIRYANGTATTRNAKILVGDQMLVADLAFPSTGSWTMWATAQVSLNLPAGKDSLILQSLTADGLPNIDWLGWMGTSPAIAICEEAPTLLNRNAAIHTLPLHGWFQNGMLHIKNLPPGESLVRIRDLSGKVLQTHRLSHADSFSVGKLGRGAYLIEVEQSQKGLRSFVASY